MINPKESRQFRIDSWLLKLLSRDMKTKTKIQKKSKVNQQRIIKKPRKLKNNKKVRTMRNINTMDYYPRNGQMGDTDP